MWSRRYPVKIMFLAVVANLQSTRNFNGRILLELVDIDMDDKDNDEDFWVIFNTFANL